MKHIYFTCCFLLIGTLLSCQNDPKVNPEASPAPVVQTETPPPTTSTPATTTEVPITTTPTTETPAGANPPPSTATPSSEDPTDAYRDITVGGIKSACDLISEAEIRRLIPGFADVQELKMTARNSPDNHASACECRAMNENIAFVIGYRKNPANLQYIDDIIEKGEFREYAANIPPYEPVQGLGQKAAFNTKHGYLKWVGNNGVLVYTYVFPTTIQTVDLYKEVLYKWAQDIDARFHAN